MTTNGTQNRSIIKNTIYLYARMFLVLIVALYSTRVVLNVLGVVDFGIYNVVGGFVSLFAFLNASMSNTVQRYYNYEKGSETGKSLKVVYNTSLVIQFIIAISTFVLLESFGLWYVNNIMVLPAERLFAANLVFQFSVISLLIVIFQIPFSADIIAHEKFDYYAYISIADVVIKLIIVLLLPYVPYDKLMFYGLLTLLVSIIDFLLYYFYAKKNFEEISTDFKIDKDLFKEMLSYTGWNLIDPFVYAINGQGLNVLLNAFFNPIVNAARGIAGQVQNALQGFSTNVVMAFRPQIVETYAENDFERTKDLMYLLTKMSFVLLSLFSLPIVLELDYILNVWLKGVVPDYTHQFTVIVIINMLLGALGTPITNVVLATGKVRNYQIWHSVVIFLTLPVSWLALKLGGSPTSVLVIMLLGTIVNHPLSMKLLHDVFPYSYKEYIVKVLIPCLAFFLLSPVLPFACTLIVEDSFMRIIYVTILSTISVCLISYFYLLSKNEKDVVKTIIKTFFSKFSN